MSIEQIAKELTLKALDKGYINPTENRNALEINNSYAEEIGRFYQNIHKSICSAYNEQYDKID